MNRLNKEVNLIAASESISEKLLILALYSELYENLYPNFNQAMMETFEFVIENLSAQKDINIDSKHFMTIYLETLKNHWDIEFWSMENFISKFSEDLSVRIEHNRKLTDIIEQNKTLPLAEKFAILTTFKEYIDTTLSKLHYCYGDEGLNLLKKDIIQIVRTELEKAIKNNHDEKFNINKTINYIKSVIKCYLILVCQYEEPNLQGPDNKEAEILSSYGALEHELNGIMEIYDIAGYNFEQLSEEELKNIAIECCDILNITKIHFFLLCILIDKRIKKASNNSKPFNRVKSKTSGFYLRNHNI